MRHLEYACALRPTWTAHALEFGVYTGDSVRRMRACLPDDVEVFGFDSFQGLPEDWRDAHGRLAGVCARGFFSTGGAVPDVPGVTFLAGWFEDTIPKYKTQAQPIGLLHVDCDLYSSTRTVLHGIGHLLVPGSIVVFDEWIYNHDPRCDDHEQRAFYEWADRYDRGFELIPFAGETDEQQIVRITY
jgi:hypothetical protein